jgi:hypothetical protein
MLIFEEVGTFIMSVALALAILGIAAVVLYYFNPQQPLDHAKAAFYPLVKPLNATHVWLGVKPSADKVEVVELKYQYNGSWFDVPVVRLTADRAVWLNTTDGRPVAVPCSANVTVAARYGTAARSLSFTPVCLQRAADVTEVFRQLTDYASYVANYLLYKSIPAITAYVKFEIGKERYLDITYFTTINAMYVGLQNIAPFAFQAVSFDNNVQDASAPSWQLWPPSYNVAVNLLPLEARDVWRWRAAHARFISYLPWSVMYRWISLVVDWDNSTLRIWVNGALAYNGTPPAAAANFTSPQGFLITFTPIDTNTANVTLYYERYNFDGRGSWGKMMSINGSVVSLIARRGNVTWWSGWVRMEDVPAPPAISFTRTIHVLPPAPYLGGNRSLFGVVTPFLVRSLTAMRASDGTIFASYTTSSGDLKTLKFNTPSGVYYMEEPLDGPVPEGFKQVVYVLAGETYAAALGLEYKKHQVCHDVDDPSRECNFFWQSFCICRDEYRWEPFYYTFGDVSCGIHLVSGDMDFVCERHGRRIAHIRFYISGGAVRLYSIDGWIINHIRSVRLGQYSAALAWTPGGRMYAISPAGIVSDTARVSIPFAYRWNLSGAYNYTLRLTIRHGIGPSDVWLNITYAGKLELIYNGKPVAVDAFYGWYRELRDGPDRGGGGDGSASATCVPTIIKVGEDQVHRDLNKGDKGYSVTVVNTATIRVAGCGTDRTYTVTTHVRTITVDGTIYQVTDPNGNVCGYDLAYRDDDGIVRCRDPKEQSR